MTQPLFSINLLGYQCEPYLPKVIDSVRAQTYKDFECMLIVEECADNSLKICQETAAADPRFKVYSRPKSGSAAAANNFGFDHAQGKYVVNIDGDDWVEPTMLADFAKQLQGHEDEIDILQYAAKIVNEHDDGTLTDGDVITNFRECDAGKIFTGKEAILAVAHRGEIRNHTVLSVCKTQFLRDNQLYMNPGLIMEDFEWTPRCWYLAKGLVYIHKVYYYYRRRKNSVNTEHSPRILFDIVKNFEHLPAFLSKYDVPLEVQRVWANQWLSLFIWYFFNRVYDQKFNRQERCEARDRLMDGAAGALLRRFIPLVSAPKKLGMRLFLASRHLGFWLPWLYFRLAYFPLLALRSHH